MTTARIRSLVAATAVAAVLAHGLSGHGLAQLGQDDMAGAAAAICVLLVSVLAFAGSPKHEAPQSRFKAEPAESPADPPVLHASDARARASPQALQRFRN